MTFERMDECCISVFVAYTSTPHTQLRRISITKSIMYNILQVAQIHDSNNTSSFACPQFVDAVFAIVLSNHFFNWWRLAATFGETSDR